MQFTSWLCRWHVTLACLCVFFMASGWSMTHGQVRCVSLANSCGCKNNHSCLHGHTRSIIRVYMTTPKNDHLCKHVLTQDRTRVTGLTRLCSTDWAAPELTPLLNMSNQSSFHFLSEGLISIRQSFVNHHGRLTFLLFVPRNILFWKGFSFHEEGPQKCDVTSATWKK